MPPQDRKAVSCEECCRRIEARKFFFVTPEGIYDILILNINQRCLEQNIWMNYIES